VLPLIEITARSGHGGPPLIEITARGGHGGPPLQVAIPVSVLVKRLVNRLAAYDKDLARAGSLLIMYA